MFVVHVTRLGAASGRPSMQYTSTRTLMCVAPTSIASNVGSDLERTKAMNRSFRLSKTCEFVISKELDSTILVDKLKAMQKEQHKTRLSFIV